MKENIAIGLEGSHSRKDLHVVVGHPYSDIGKGWVAAAIGSNLGLSTPIIKIDPMLSSSFPRDIGVLVDGEIVTDDATTYTSRGLSFSPKMNIVMGEWMRRAFQESTSNQRALNGEIFKATYSNLAHQLASDINDLAKGKSAVIEMGGCPDDEEATLPANAIRVLAGVYGYRVFLHVVSAYNVTSKGRGYRLRNRMPIRAVKTAMQVYWGVSLADLKVYARRADVPSDISDERLMDESAEVALRIGCRPDQVKYIPNLSGPEELDKYIFG